MKKQGARESGVLLPISSLFGAYGIGDFGKEARMFIGWLKKAGIQNWFLLPLNPTSYGNSPYQSPSAFAGNINYISPEQLAEEELLNGQELKQAAVTASGQVDYGQLFSERPRLLAKAYRRFRNKGWHERPDYLDFCREKQHWLDDYAAYMTIKEEMGYLPWSQWPDTLAGRKEPEFSAFINNNREHIDFWKFTQFIFFRQWNALRRYAGRNGIGLVGDMPFYVAHDSADVWSHRELFAVSPQNGEIIMQAGVPIDDFSSYDRNWGNPVYQWENHAADGYQWFRQRIQAGGQMYDGLRIDHVIAVKRYYGIRKDGEKGMWYDGPDTDQYALSSAMNEEAEKAGLRIIAEDLGQVPPGLRERLKEIGWLRMRVLQFAFMGKYGPLCDHLPFYYDRDMAVYTGTHDNPTLKEFLDAKTGKELRYLRWWTGKKKRKALAWALIEEAYKSIAGQVVIPLQDFLGLGSEARICVPDDYEYSWKWRMAGPSVLDEALAQKIKKLAVLTGRCQPQDGKFSVYMNAKK